MSAPPVQIYKLSIAPLFDRLSEQEKRYAHFLSRAAWSGTRIILRQVSPESISIFDFILELYESCHGNWEQITMSDGISGEDLEQFLRYAATFLSNIGNYYGSGDQKFIPQMSPDSMEKFASRSDKLRSLYLEIQRSLMSIPPFTLGYPGPVAQSSYYLGESIKREEVSLVSRHMGAHSILPENTRIRKTGENAFEVLQASAVKSEAIIPLNIPDSAANVSLVQGNHADDLGKVCEDLSRAATFAANETRRKFINEYTESFRTGSLHVYRDSQRTWITDKAPKVENIFGFVEPYRDPAGIRAEFEGLVAIADVEETKLLSKLVEKSDRFIRRLPWATPENNGKGVFEKSLFEPPDFSSIHAACLFNILMIIEAHDESLGLLF